MMVGAGKLCGWSSPGDSGIVTGGEGMKDRKPELIWKLSYVSH